MSSRTMMFVCDFRVGERIVEVPVEVTDEDEDEPLRGRYYYRGGWFECDRDAERRSDSANELAACVASWVEIDSGAKLIAIRPNDDHDD